VCFSLIRPRYLETNNPKSMQGQQFTGRDAYSNGDPGHGDAEQSPAGAEYIVALEALPPCFPDIIKKSSIGGSARKTMGRL
jgi:hypothetical protein